MFGLFVEHGPYVVYKNLTGSDLVLQRQMGIMFYQFGLRIAVPLCLQSVWGTLRGRADTPFCTLTIRYLFLFILNHLQMNKMHLSLGVEPGLESVICLVCFRLEPASASLKMTKVLLRTRMTLAEISTGLRSSSVFSLCLFFCCLTLHLFLSLSLKVLWRSSSSSFLSISPMSFMPLERQVLPFRPYKSVLFTHFYKTNRWISDLVSFLLMSLHSFQLDN